MPIWGLNEARTGIIEDAAKHPLSLETIARFEHTEPRTAAHTWNVARVTNYLVKKLGLPEEFGYATIIGAFGHDYGKSRMHGGDIKAIRETLYAPRDELTAEQRMQLRQHPVLSGQAIRDNYAHDPYLDIYLEAAFGHHEENADADRRYPRTELRRIISSIKEDINTLERKHVARVIVAGADMYCGALEDRPYRTGPANVHDIVGHSYTGPKEIKQLLVA
jgi:hypothetical protein